MANSNLIVWLDLETTGLDPQTSQILEVAMVVVDYQHVEHASYQVVVRSLPEDWRNVHQVVVDMHRSSGLLEESLGVVGRPLAQTEDEALAFLGRWFSAVKPLMGGRNPGFDRSFLAVHMSRLAALFDHHLIDLCTLQEMRRLWWPDMPAFDNHHAHRALDDVRESIREMRYYVERIEG